MSFITYAMQAVLKKAVEIAPESWLPGGKPDPLIGREQGLIGKSISRVDGPLKVTGRAPFAAEFPMEGLLYASLVCSSVPRGRIVSLDAAGAEAAPGVRLVMTHRNAPKLKPAPAFMTAAKAAAGDSIPVMQDDQIHWNGQPIAVVLADTQEQADFAKSLIRCAYAREAAVTVFDEAKTQTEPGMFQGEPLLLKIGDAESAFADAPVKIDSLYRTPRHNHNAIELHAVTLRWEGDNLILHDASQCVSHTAWTLAQVFGLDEAQVHVTSPFVGGGFGGKTLWQHQILAAAASKVAGRPVRLMLSREDVYRLVGGRTLTEQRVALGAQSEGRFEAIIQTGVVPMGRHNNMPEPFILPAKSAYASRTFKLDVETTKMDMLSNTFMRAPGESVGTFALECAVDELAERLGMDPIELRMRNEPDKDPTAGTPFSSRHIVEAYRAGAERFGWSARDARPGTRRKGEWLVGLGCATATYPYYRMPGGAARLTLTKDGFARVEIAAHEMGMGTATTHALVTAERLGLPMERVTVAYGDSRFPGVVLAGGSQQTASVGAAIVAAHRELVTELLKMAGKLSPLAGLKPEEVAGHDGWLVNVSAPERRESYASILALTGRAELTVEASAPPPFEIQHWSMHSHGAMFCEVLVNSVTGEPRVSRFLGSFDCGRILNAKTAASQFRGGIVMGLGLALMEETEVDERNGRVMNPSLAEYHVPVHMDVPQIDVMWTDIPDPHAPMGAHGVGEIGITGVGAAVANAVYNATGKRVRELPITLDKILRGSEMKIRA
jgi:xanthine dehydrogenase YagR molybdenum-binding subunit